MASLKWGTELYQTYSTRAGRKITAAAACSIIICGVTLSPSFAQAESNVVSLIRALGSAAGIIDACNENDDLGQKVTALVEKPAVAPVKEYMIDGYKKGLNEKQLWDSGRWEQISCDKLRENGMFEKTEKSTTDLLDKMLAN